MSVDLKLENQICFKVYSITKSIIIRYGPLLNEINLTYPQYVVMMLLWEHKKLPFNEISSKLKMKRGTLNPIISKLESNVYLERVKYENDYGEIYIVITQKGLDIEKVAKDIPVKIAKDLNLSEEEYKNYIKAFDDLLKRLDSI